VPAALPPTGKVGRSVAAIPVPCAFAGLTMLPHRRYPFRHQVSCFDHTVRTRRATLRRRSADRRSLDGDHRAASVSRRTEARLMGNHRAGFFISYACQIGNECNPLPVLAAAQQQPAIFMRRQSSAPFRHLGRADLVGRNRIPGRRCHYPVRRNGFLASTGAST
jgi:hypothetical protein